MSKKTYLWIEDRRDKAGYVFWKTLMRQLYPEMVVESKRNSSELVKAVKALQDQENQYIIVCDNAFDNLQVYQEQKVLKRYADRNGNVFLMDIICFEYILLEFDRLTEWIYAPGDEFLEKRADAIRARELLVSTIQSGELNYRTIREILLYDRHLANHSVEQLSAKLLFDLTRNTGFEVSKGTIGACWINSCCDWAERQENDICGLDSSRLSIAEKMKSIYLGTSLAEEFLRAGMEVAM